jgi:hypothetical protein
MRGEPASTMLGAEIHAQSRAAQSIGLPAQMASVRIWNTAGQWDGTRTMQEVKISR